MTWGEPYGGLKDTTAAPWTTPPITQALAPFWAMDFTDERAASMLLERLAREIADHSSRGETDAAADLFPTYRWLSAIATRWPRDPNHDTR